MSKNTKTSTEGFGKLTPEFTEGLSQTSWFLVGLFATALVVRLTIAFNTYVISSDGPLYIEAASYYYNGEFRKAFSHPYHPLYPFLMSLAYRLVGNWEWAGMLISVILSSLAVIPLYLIGLKLFSNKAIAFISASFYIFHPHIARLSSGTLTTGTFILMLITALYFFIRALENWRYLYFVLTGLFTLLAFLTRPDGIVLFLICFLWIIFLDVKTWWKDGGWKKKLLALLFFTLPWLVLAIPYIAYITITTGQFSISHKLTLDNFLAMANPIIHPNSLYIVLEDFIKSFKSPWLLLLLIIGVIARKGNIGKAFQLRNIWLIWSVFLFYILALIKFADFVSRISTRYTTPLLAIIIFWSAIGLYILVRSLVRIKDKSISEDSPLFLKWLGVGVLITIISFAVFTFRPVRKERLPERKVGEWIKQYHMDEEPPIIVSDSNRIPYYGGSKIIRNYEGIHLKGFRVNYEGLIKRLRELKVNYLVIDKTKIDALIPGFTAQLNPTDLEQIYALPPEKEEEKPSIFVYRVK